jgi:hypothetical protein
MESTYVVAFGDEGGVFRRGRDDVLVAGGGDWTSKGFIINGRKVPGRGVVVDGLVVGGGVEG